MVSRVLLCTIPSCARQYGFAGPEIVENLRVSRMKQQVILDVMIFRIGSARLTWHNLNSNDWTRAVTGLRQSAIRNYLPIMTDLKPRYWPKHIRNVHNVYRQFKLTRFQCRTLKRRSLTRALLPSVHQCDPVVPGGCESPILHGGRAQYQDRPTSN